MRERRDVDVEKGVKRADGYHVPVLRDETIQQLITDPNGIYIDATFGGGGHSRAILDCLGSEGHLFGIDRDLDAQAHCDITDPRFTFVRSDFRYIHRFMNYFGIQEVDGILADLGLSSHHLDSDERGFSFRFDAPLDMRMNQSAPRTAAHLIAETDEAELRRILKEYGEVRHAGRVAALLKQGEDTTPIPSVSAFLDRIAPVVPREDKKELARVFQALRIVVNDEMAALDELLDAGKTLLKEGGHFTIITYHSLEDRPVKNYFRTGNTGGERETDLYGVSTAPFKPLSNKPTLPSDTEIATNPRARSAKLRTAIRL